MRPYKEEALSGALAEMRQGGLSLRQAARKYGVPLTTLHDRKSGKVDEGSKWGKAPLLPYNKEKELISYVMKRADLGIGFSKANFLRFAGDFAKSEGSPFKGGVATEKWWRGLKQRHPDFSLRCPEPTSTGRHTAMNRLHVTRYFGELKNVLESNGLLNKGSLIWNMDETGLNLAPKRPKILARKGSRVVHAKSSQSRELVTLIACGNADGKILPPHVIIPGKTKRALQSYNIDNAPNGTMLSVSDSGWTKQGICELWFDQTFLPNIGSIRPQILIMDGHDSHHHVEIVKKARDNGIILMELPAKTSHFTQPFDRSVFKLLKTRWSEEINTFTANTGVTVGHSQFFRMLKPAWENSMTIENISSGFIATGICPYNPGAIPDIAFAPSDLYSDMSAAPEDVESYNELPQQSISTVSSPSNATITSDQDLVFSLDIPVASTQADVVDLPVTVGTDGFLSVNSAEATLPAENAPVIKSHETVYTDSLNMMVDVNTQFTRESQTGPTPSTSVSTVTECTSEMALSVIESAITDSKREIFENALKRGLDIQDSLFHTWATYKKKVPPTTSTSNPLLSLPALPIKKSKQNSKKNNFFVITADEAYNQQLQAKLEKQKKEEELQERKRKRLLKKSNVNPVPISKN